MPIVAYLNNIECLCSDRVREVTSRRTNSPYNADTAFSAGVTYAYHSASSLVEGCQTSTQVSREPIFCIASTNILTKKCSIYVEQYNNIVQKGVCLSPAAPDWVSSNTTEHHKQGYEWAVLESSSHGGTSCYLNNSGNMFS